MINEAALLVNGSIPLAVTLQTQTNWVQFLTTIVITLLGSFGVFIFLFGPQVIKNIFSFSGSLRRIAKITRRNVVMIKHTDQGLFSQSMIDQTCLRELSAAMNELEGESFDLILHTPGGDIFSSLAISRMIKQYPGKVRAIIPMYSMSGGSLLALSCSEIMMTPNACLGPIDPQLGSLFKYGSAAAWEKIVKFKGKKAEDQSISFAMMGKQYTTSINKHLKNIIDFDLNGSQKEKLVTFLTDGSIEHAYPLTITDLNKFGINVNIINNKKLLEKLSKIITSKTKEGVNYYKVPKRWKR